MLDARKHFLEFDLEGWKKFADEFGQPKFRGEQISKWVYEKGVCNVASFENIPKAFRDILETQLDWTLPEIVSQLSSEDGSTKLLLKSKKGHLIESVILRYEGRTSLCVSSQVGCKLACSFCQTGKLGFFRHLDRSEILGQYFLARQIVSKENRRLSHVVFMGMGEPLDNYDNVVSSVKTLVSSVGFGLSARHVTISTSGIANKLENLAKDARCALAVSLHAANDELRTELMPINRKFDLADLKVALKNYQKLTGDIITLEYILIKDKNCSEKNAKELVSFIHGLRTKVNLIPFNAHPGLPYQRPTAEEIRAFQKYLSDRSTPAPVRYSKGLEVSAACGQLAAKVSETLGLAPSRKNALSSQTL